MDALQPAVISLGPVLQPLVGGLLIGAAAALLWVLQGRVAGISGIAGGLFDRPESPVSPGTPESPESGDRTWRLVFLLGLVGGGALMWRVLPGAFGLAAAAAGIGSIGALALAAIAGLLVGLGTSISSGCTSGHGVCGISRLSPRSMVATATFMGAGAVTALLAGQLLGRGGL
jgi:uncharacterized membrane protein YedE/YeeE